MEGDSSGIDHRLERKIPINANHIDMCKFAKEGTTKNEYDEKVQSEVLRHWAREKRRLQVEAQR